MADTFFAKDEAELFHRYALLTWNPTERNKQKLRERLEDHPEYVSYVDLHEKGKLPAKQATLNQLHVVPVDATQQLYNVVASYSLVLQDNTMQDIKVELQVSNQGLDVMNKRFNTTGDVSEGTLPEPANEQEQKRQEFMMRILKEISWRMNQEQLLEILK